MKKIIVALDGLKYSERTTNCAIDIARSGQSHLIGVFLDDFTYHTYRIYDLVKAEGGIFESKRKKLDKKDAKARAVAVKNFETACQKSGVDYTLHHDRSIAIQELLHETVYADLLIINMSETFTHHEEDLPTVFIRDLLHSAQCPVFLVPEKYKPVNRLILLYDGTPSSVHAIKMFVYTLPGLRIHPVEAVTVKSAKQTENLPDSRLMKEFMTRHFPNANYTVLKGSPESEILKYLKAQKDSPLVVLGAYRRNRISRWFHPSMADMLMSNIELPLFIAHNK